MAEAFLSTIAGRPNIDSPAVWHGASGQAWVISTGKSNNVLYVHDATSGRLIRTVGGRGTAPGEFRRPNGIAVAGDLLLVVERDNARVQAFRLPGFEPLARFGHGTLRRPYGITVLERQPAVLDVFVTDDYRRFLGRHPPDRELAERVKHYRLDLGGGQVMATYIRAFGDTAGAGRLRKVESLAVDPDAGLLLVADEADRAVKVYRVDGSFTGMVLWEDLIHHEPEGMVLYRCGVADGYWVLADQHRRSNRFLVFGRSRFEYLGAFTGTAIRNTDGLALTQRPLPSLPAGALYAVHRDIGVGAFSWSEIATALELRADCVAQRPAPAG